MINLIIIKQSWLYLTKHGFEAWSSFRESNYVRRRVSIPVEGSIACEPLGIANHFQLMFKTSNWEGGITITYMAVDSGLPHVRSERTPTIIAAIRIVFLAIFANHAFSLSLSCSRTKIQQERLLLIKMPGEKIKNLLLCFSWVFFIMFA